MKCPGNLLSYRAGGADGGPPTGAAPASTTGVFGDRTRAVNRSPLQCMFPTAVS
jgi:hypothetical protein